MAATACGRLSKPFGVAVFAIGLLVCLIEFHPCAGMIEIFGDPALAMAVLAGWIQLLEGAPLFVALRTGQLLVEGFEREAGACFVVEPFGFLLDMAQSAVVRHIMAFFTILMRIIPDMRRMGLWVMAACAAFLAVAIDTFQPEQVGVFLMVEGDDGAIGNLGSFVDILFRGFDVGVQASHDVEVGVLHSWRCIGDGSAGSDFPGDFGTFGMAYIAVGFVAPLTMAAEALAMIGAFQSGLSEIGRVGGAAMAFTAGKDSAGGIVVMANRASLAHFLHVGMQLVREIDRFIQANQLIQENNIRAMSGGIGNAAHFFGAFTFQQAGILMSWLFTRVAVFAACLRIAMDSIRGLDRTGIRPENRADYQQQSNDKQTVLAHGLNLPV